MHHLKKLKPNTTPLVLYFSTKSINNLNRRYICLHETKFHKYNFVLRQLQDWFSTFFTILYVLKTTKYPITNECNKDAPTCTTMTRFTLFLQTSSIIATWWWNPILKHSRALNQKSHSTTKQPLQNAQCMKNKPPKIHKRGKSPLSQHLKSFMKI